MKPKLLNYGLSLLTAGAALYGVTTTVHAADKKPNILVIWGDDIGTWNISHNPRPSLRPRAAHRDGRELPQVDDRVSAERDGGFVQPVEDAEADRRVVERQQKLALILSVAPVGARDSCRINERMNQRRPEFRDASAHRALTCRGEALWRSRERTEVRAPESAPFLLFAPVQNKKTQSQSTGDKLSPVQITNHRAIMKKDLAIFEGYEIRRLYDEKTETWFFSVVDIVQVLTQQPNYKAAQNYWKVLKHRLNKEGSQLVTHCNQLKLPATDGKSYLADVANAETLIQQEQAERAEAGKEFSASPAISCSSSSSCCLRFRPLNNNSVLE